jgi:hypothetical protein
VRFFTEEEARAYLPRLRGLLAVLRRSAKLSVRAGSNGHGRLKEESAESSSDGEEDEPVDLDPRGALAELEEQGIILRDPVRGLVDFPTRHRSGKVVHLCWQLGEDDIGWWHLPEDGFGGRRPLPIPPTL